MNIDNRAIHETVIRDIIDLYSGIKDSDEVKQIGVRGGMARNYTSVARATNNLVLVFPVICTTSVGIQIASMGTKAIERKALTMLQLLFSAIGTTDAQDAIEYIQRYHKNIKAGSMSVDDYIDIMDSFVEESASTDIDRELYEAVSRDMKNINFMLEDSFNPDTIARFKVSKNRGQISITEAVPIFSRDRDINTRAVKDITGSMKDLNDIEKNVLIDTDVKKCNELVPSLMIVRVVDENGVPDQFVIGVKAKLIPVSSYDIMDRIRIKNEDRNGLLKLIRATTREISFFRDFMFAVDKAKIDSLSQSRKGSSSKMWKVLERRSLKSKLRRSLSHYNDASAITTIIISQEEVEYMKKEYSIDVNKPSVIRPIMNAYNLMGFVIMDESLEVAKFIFDTGDDLYENLSFNSLEKESSNGEYKKIINLMSKMNR